MTINEVRAAPPIIDNITAAKPPTGPFLKTVQSIIEKVKIIFTSPTMQIIALSIGACVLSPYLLSLPLTLTISAFAMVVLIPLSQFKKLKFEISFLYTILTIQLKKSNQWYDEITMPDGKILVLGAIPLKSQIQKLQKLGIKKVITLLEPFEMKPSIFATPATKEDWQKVGIEHLHIVSPDYQGVAHKKISEAIQAIKKTPKDDKIYIHCKAGRGRSASIVIAYLTTYCNMSLDKAIQFVKERRTQINLNPKQKLNLQNFEALRIKKTQ